MLNIDCGDVDICIVEMPGYDPRSELCKSPVLPIELHPQGAPMPNVTRNCEWCQAEFVAHTRDTKRGRARFCSLSCSGKAGNALKPRGKNPAHWVTVSCATCGTDFEKKLSSLANSKSGLYFCCRSHKDQAQRLGGIEEIMPPHYGSKSTVTSKDYSFARTSVCQRCGYGDHPEILHVHHINRDRTNNDPSNLICLCPNCHDTDHLLAGDGRFRS